MWELDAAAALVSSLIDLFSFFLSFFLTHSGYEQTGIPAELKEFSHSFCTKKKGTKPLPYETKCKIIYRIHNAINEDTEQKK